MGWKLGGVHEFLTSLLMVVVFDRRVLHAFALFGG